MKKFHCCATCIHFSVEKVEKEMLYRCIRLGFPTKTYYQFRCWIPKDHVRKLMEKEAGHSSTC